MELNEILSTVDHTLLSQGATWEEIQAVCDDGMKYRAASVCIPASYVRQAKEYVGDKLAVCTVIGFPNGYSTTAAKCFETEDAVRNGADEIDMVINIGWAKDKKWDALLEEIRAVKAACGGRVLKVIIETCLLTDEEKVKLCEIVSNSGADFIKTSTGFAGGGATREDVALFAKREDQGGRRHLQPPGRGGLHPPGRVPAGHQPHCQGCQGDRGQRVLMDTGSQNPPAQLLN